MCVVVGIAIIGIELYPHHEMLTIASKVLQIYLRNSLILARLSFIVVITREQALENVRRDMATETVKMGENVEYVYSVSEMVAWIVVDGRKRKRVYRGEFAQREAEHEANEIAMRRGFPY